MGFGRSQRNRVFERSGGRCEAHRADLTRCTSDAVAIHHVVPRCKGGTHHISNLMHVCAPCHVRLDREALGDYRPKPGQPFDAASKVKLMELQPWLP